MMLPAGGEGRPLIQASDEMLVEQARGGRFEAFDSIYRRYSKSLLNYVSLVIGDNSLSERIAKESFLRLYKKLPHYNFQERVPTVLFRLATRLLMDAQKRSRLPFESWLPTANFLFLRDLSLRDRVLFLLSEAYGFHAKEVQAILASEENFLGSRMAELREKLPGNWKEDWNQQVNNGAPDGLYLTETVRPDLERLNRQIRLQRMGWLGLAGSLVFVLAFGLHPVLKRVLDEGLVKTSMGLSDKGSRIVGDPGEVALSRFILEDREKGEVLGVEYVFHKAFVAGEVVLELAPQQKPGVIPERFSLSVKGETALKCPEALIIELRGSGQAVARRTLRGLSEKWTQFEFPIRGVATPSIDEVAFIFDSEKVLETRGKVFIADISLA